MGGFTRRLQQGSSGLSGVVLGPPGSYKPDDTNTGYAYTGASLTPVTNNYTITTDNTTLDSLDITGWVVVKAANVTIRRCRVRGGAAKTYNTGLIDCNDAAASNVLIEDCLLVPDTPSLWYDGIIGHDYTAQRNNIYHTVDGCGAYNSNATGPINVNIYANFIHDLSGYLDDPNHSNGPTHNDCIQHQGGNDVQIIGNNLLGFVSPTVADGANWSGNTQFSNPSYGNGLQTNSAIQLNENTDSITSGLIINSNWADGAYITFNLPVGPPAAHIDQIMNNQFGRNQGAQGSGGDTTHTLDLRSTTTYGTISGNVYEDNQDPVDVRFNG
jgi:hypothetical protein